jgi:hypothetical protein
VLLRVNYVKIRVILADDTIMELFTRVESHAQDLFKLQDVPGGKLSRTAKRLPPLPVGTTTTRASRDDSALAASGIPPTALVGPRKLPKSKSTIGLAAIPEEDVSVTVADASVSEAVMTKKPAPTPTWITTKSLTSEDLAKIHYEDLFGCFTRNFGKGFALGFFGRVGINAFFEVVGIMRRRGLPTDGVPISKALLDGSREHGLFLGLLLSVFNSFMYTTRNAPMPYARYRGAMAGALSGLASMWALPGAMRRSALLFLSVRAFELACRVAAKQGRVPTLHHGDTYLMSLASAMMIYEWMFFPGALDKAYVHFLQRQVQFDSTVVKAVAAMQRGLPLDVDAINKTRATFRPPPPPISDALIYDKLPTGAAKGAFLFHPTTSFVSFAVTYFLRGLRVALPVYVPVYLVPLVVFSHRRLMAKPVDTLMSTAQGIATSTLFLATYCTLGITSISLFRTLGLRYDVVGNAAEIGLALSGALAGLSTVIEKKHRRIELALYVLQRALDGVHKIASEKFGEHVASPVFGDSALFAALVAMVAHSHLRHADLVRPAYRSFLTRFFDTDERHVFL